MTHFTDSYMRHQEMRIQVTWQRTRETVVTTWVVYVFEGFDFIGARQNGRRFADVILKSIFLGEKLCISIQISIRFILCAPIDNMPSFFQIIPWRLACKKSLSGPIMVYLLTNICGTRPRWVNAFLSKTTTCTAWDWYNSEKITITTKVAKKYVFCH